MPDAIEVKLCSRCGLKPSYKDAGGPCRDCTIAYVKENRKLNAAKRERAARFRGAEEMRRAVLEYCERIGFTTVTGYEVATAVRQFRV